MLFLLSPAFAAIPHALTAAPFSEADIAEHESIFAEIELPEHASCRTGLVLALRDHWDHLSGAERTFATSALAPGRADLFAPRVERNPAGAPPPAKGACWAAEMENSLDTEHFHIEYEDGVDVSDIEQFAEDLEFSWTVQIDEEGWDAPSGTGSYLTSIYVQNANTYGAYTSRASCNGTDMAYIVSGKDSWNNMEWGATMATHEFNHAVQYGYSEAPEFWWWEATATWIENLVFPDSYQWSGYVAGYTENPWIALDAEDQRDQDVFYHMYGMAIWAFYLEDNMGGSDAVRETWENAADQSGYYNYGAEDMVDDLGGDFDAVYVDFAMKNTVMDYVEGQWMPSVDLKETYSSFPADGGSSGSDVPQGYGQNYYKFKDGSGEGKLTVKFEGDEDVDWLVAIVEGDNNEILRVDSSETGDGTTSVSLDAVGDEDVYLVISPLTTKSGEYEYEWEATIEEESSGNPDDTGETDDTGGGNDDDDDDDEADGDNEGDDNEGNFDEGGSAAPVACGCDAGGASPIVGVAVALTSLLSVRRRSLRR